MQMEWQTVQTHAPLGAVWSGSALFAQTYLSENLGSLRGSHGILARGNDTWLRATIWYSEYKKDYSYCLALLTVLELELILEGNYPANSRQELSIHPSL